jgi:hypothetical protein
MYAWPRRQRGKQKIRVGLRRIADFVGQFEAQSVSSPLTRRSTVDPQLTLIAPQFVAPINRPPTSGSLASRHSPVAP